MSNMDIPNGLYRQGGNTDLPAALTKAGSKQTYYTFRFLADRDQRDASYRAYAYFRWLDDILDCRTGNRQEKLDFLQRQQSMLEACYRGAVPDGVSPEEQMLVDLVQNDKEERSGMQTYLHNMMKVMSFDVHRCGREVSLGELTEYTHWLSSAVTELLFYLIGHGDPTPGAKHRYHAVSGAHVVHMLRDTVDDIEAGYFNFPAGLIDVKRFSPDDLRTHHFRKWVYHRVKLARMYFATGRKYIAQVKNLRCRMAGFAYIARFEWMLRKIEQDNYCLRTEYPDRKGFNAALWMVWRVIVSALRAPMLTTGYGKQAPITELIEEG